MADRRTLWEIAGGRGPILAMTTIFLEGAREDPVLGPLFRHVPDGHARYLADWFGVIFGGPSDYVRDRGGLPFVVWAHADMRITDGQRARWVSLMRDAAAAAELPEDFLPIFDRYVSTISGYVQSNSHLDRDRLETMLGPDPTDG
ncbi:MAG: oxidoreductase [Pseudomonadota bacterium]